MARCYLCDRRQEFGQSYFSNGRRVVCTACADALFEEELELLMGVTGGRALLLELGFWWECE